MNMDPIEWTLELDKMLDSIETKSFELFERINQRLMAFSLPFSEAFQQHVLKMANIRWVRF